MKSLKLFSTCIQGCTPWNTHGWAPHFLKQDALIQSVRQNWP